MHFFLELLYFLYPFLRDLVLYPIMGFFSVSNKLLGTQAEIIGLISPIISMSLFFALGAIFVLYIFFSFFNNTKEHKSRNWRLIFTMFFGLALFVELLKHFYSETFIGGYLQMSTLFIVYIGTIFLGICSLFFFGLKLVIKILKRVSTIERSQLSINILVSLLFLAGLYPFVALTMAATEIFIDPIGHPQSTRFAVVHAAIKNTCIFDKKQENCPHSLKEISYIEPERFAEMMQGNQVQYVYYPETNDYSLVVRYSPVRAVVFDQRLIAEHGLDFWEYEVDLLGQDEIKDPPKFTGPWEFEEWDYLN